MNQWKPIAELAADVNAGRVTARELVERSLKIIEQGKAYNALINVVDKVALARADALDKQIKSNKTVGRLAGVPYVAKDNFLTKGIETTAGSNILKGFIPPYQATAIQKLEDEGAILVGKANLDAFAHGSSTENSDFGPTKNPHDITRVPGGSSGGSAAAVAAGMAPFALGTDTGGSIRLPASFTGTVGLKPTYGLISRYGVVAMASSTDVVGPLTNRAEDAALILDILAGVDKHDSTTIARRPSYIDSRVDLNNLKVGVIKQHMRDGLSPEVREAVHDTIKLLEKQGAQMSQIDMPLIDLSLACYYIIVPAEVSSNLMRYDGIRYGYTAKDAKNLAQVYDLTRTRGFNDENKRRIMIGTHVLSSGYYDAYYKKAQTFRTKLIDQFNQVFESVDVLVGPTSPNTAFKLGENTKDPLSMYMADIMTVATNLVGVPGISLPIGTAQGLPIGFQIMAPQGEDGLMLAVAKRVEELIK